MEEIITAEGPVIIEPPRNKRRLWWIPVCIVLVLAIAAVAAYFLTADLRAYNDACQLQEQGYYQEAAAVFEALGDYRDAEARATDCRYEYAEKLFRSEEFDAAIAIYETLGDYEDSEKRILKASYTLGLWAMEDGELDAAIDCFTRAGDGYKDARGLRLQATYERGHQLFMERKAEEAQPYFDRLLEEAPEYYIPHFEEAQEAIAYLKAMEEPKESFTVAARVISPFYQNMNYWNLAVQQSLGYQFADIEYDEEKQTVTITPDYYPGQRIVWAWQSGDFSGLSEKEQQTFDAAMALVERGRQATDDEMELELWLHDWLCDNVVYDSPYAYVYPEDYVGLDELTCVGAILNGKANCQGYADAFYLLGTLAGMEVHKVFGEVEEGGHCWNAVRLDGWLYTVDVTFNDSYCGADDEQTYIWYNNALDMNHYNVFGGVSQFEKMTFLQDESKTYYAMQDLIFEDLDDAVLQLLKRLKKNGKGIDTALVKETGLDEDDFYDAVSRNLGKAGLHSARWWVAFEVYKEATYITVSWQ